MLRSWWSRRTGQSVSATIFAKVDVKFVLPSLLQHPPAKTRDVFFFRFTRLDMDMVVVLRLYYQASPCCCHLDLCVHSHSLRQEVPPGSVETEFLGCCSGYASLGFDGDLTTSLSHVVRSRVSCGSHLLATRQCQM